MKRAAGLLMYRRIVGEIEIFLVHPGGPLWANKDAESWTMPKGEYEDPEPPLEAAQREFHEETGFVAREPFLALGSKVQSSKKLLTAYAFEGDCDPSLLKSNTCEVLWPPGSARKVVIPEIDRGEWFTIDAARPLIRPGQLSFLCTLLDVLGAK